MHKVIVCCDYPSLTHTHTPFGPKTQKIKTLPSTKQQFRMPPRLKCLCCVCVTSRPRSPSTPHRHTTPPLRPVSGRMTLYTYINTCTYTHTHAHTHTLTPTRARNQEYTHTHSHIHTQHTHKSNILTAYTHTLAPHTHTLKY